MLILFICKSYLINKMEKPLDHQFITLVCDGLAAEISLSLYLVLMSNTTLWCYPYIYLHSFL